MCTKASVNSTTFQAYEYSYICWPEKRYRNVSASENWDNRKKNGKELIS